METLATTARPASDAFRANRSAQAALVRQLRERLAVASRGGLEHARERHVARGKMEHVLRAPTDGTVALLVAVGTQVAAGEVLATVVPDEGSARDEPAPTMEKANA